MAGSARGGSSFAGLIVLLLTACASAPGPNATYTAGSVVYVVRRGWHIDVGLPVDQLSPPLLAITASFPGARYLVFGLGDRRYVESIHHRAPVLLQALWPGPAVLLATGLKTAPDQAFGSGHVVALWGSPAQVREVEDFIWASLVHPTLSDELPEPALGPYGGSLYFSAHQTYSAAHTCNTWAAEALHAGHWPVRSRGVVFAGQLWGQFEHPATATKLP